MLLHTIYTMCCNLMRLKDIDLAAQHHRDAPPRAASEFYQPRIDCFWFLMLPFPLMCADILQEVRVMLEQLQSTLKITA